MNPPKCILIILDGLGDRACEALGGLTPLQAASTPNLDLIASRGGCGIMYPAIQGMALPSEEAHFSLFGYSPEEFPGRGVLEAMGAGIDVVPGAAYLLAHFASVTPGNRLLLLKEKRPETYTALEVEELCRMAVETAEQTGGLRFEHTHGLDGILVATPPASRYITDSDPMIKGMPALKVMPWHGHEADPYTVETSVRVNRFIKTLFRRLEGSGLNISRQEKGLPPVNIMLSQRAGAFFKTQPFQERWGLKGLSVSSGLMYEGMASFLGMDNKTVMDTEDFAVDLRERIGIALETKHDFVHVHTKRPDQAAHNRKPEYKKEGIEELDRAFDVVNDYRGGDVLFVITADHSTPSTGEMVHSAEPVPVIISGPNVRRDNCMSFDETSCATGGLGQIDGRRLMSHILNLMDRAKLHGLMDSPYDQPFYPGNRTPLSLEATEE